MKRKPKYTLVELTQLDIREGKPGDPHKCAVARAIAKAMGRAVVVRADYWRFLDDYDCSILPVPVCKFIKRFDRHARVEPMTFRVTRL